MLLDTIHAAIFDLDGTLLDTLGDIAAAANRSLARYGLPQLEPQRYRALVGHGIRRLFGQAIAQEQQAAYFDAVLAAYLADYPAHCTEHTTYFPGVQAFLEMLSQRGIRLAVISNKTETTAQKVMAHYFPEVEWAFLWGNNGTRPLKPAVEAGKLACETLGLSPSEILYVGDGDTDMEFASAMGFVAAGVTWGYRDREQLLAAGADFLSDSFEELAQNLGLSCQRR